MKPTSPDVFNKEKEIAQIYRKSLKILNIAFVKIAKGGKSSNTIGTGSASEGSKGE